MALTINDFSGAETRGTDEFSAISGTVFTSGSQVRTGVFTYSLDISPFGSGEFAPFASVADAGNDYVCGFGIRFGDLTPNTNPARFLSLREGSSEFFALEETTDGDLLIIDAAGSTIRTVSPSPFTVFVYSFVEIYFQHQASATVEVFVDGVSLGSDSGQDLTDGGTFDTVRFETVSGGAPFSFDDYYFMSGATAAADRLGDAEVFMYQNTAEDATDQGDTLANGTWALVSETPLNEGTSNDAFYQDTGNLTGSTICDEGTRSGPSGDANVDGDSNIKAAKWIGWFKRSTGGGRTHNFYGGNDGAGANHATWIASNDAKTLGMTLTVGYVTHTMISEGTEVPSSSEDFQYGFSKDATAGQDIFCGDIWAMLLHVPSTGPAPTINLVMAPYIPI